MFGLIREQPRAFYLIFLLEIWERFGYYTVQGILTLYFIRHLGYSETQAYYTFGAFVALVYGFITIGGYLGDKVLGRKRTLLLGLGTLCLGYLALALANQKTVFFALGLVSIGNSLFKANPSALLAQCYEKRDNRLQGAFTLYYMAINLGSTIALIAGPYLSANYGYFYAYFASFLGLLLGFINYLLQHHYIQDINNAADLRRLSFWQWLLVLTGIVLAAFISSFLLKNPLLSQIVLYLGFLILLGIYYSYLRQESGRERIHMWVALVLMIEGGLFFVLYQQMPTSLNLFAVHNVRPYLLGVPIDPQSFQVLNPLWVLFLSPLVAYFYRTLYLHNRSMPIPYKFALGMIFCGLSFSFLFFARFFPDAQGMVSSGWMVGSYFFQTLGEILVSALGVAMIAELVPAHISGFVMGMWYVFTAIAGFVGGFVASFTALPETLSSKIVSLSLYTRVFLGIGLITLAVGFTMMLLAVFLSRNIVSELEA